MGAAAVPQSASSPAGSAPADSAAPAAAPSPTTVVPSLTSSAAANALAAAPLATDGTVGVSFDSVADPSKNVVATVKQRQGDFFYRYSEPVVVKGEKFTLKINFPIEESLSELEKSSSKKQDLKDAVQKFAKLLLQDLLKQLDELPSKDLDTVLVFFDNSADGYIVTTDTKYNPYDPGAAKDNPNVVVAKSEASKALNKAITNHQGTPDELRRLLEVSALDSLRTTVRNQDAEKSKTQAPANLLWKNNSCAIDASLNILLHEPTIARELADAANYEGEKDNALFKVVTQYRECQDSGGTLDAATILRTEGSKDLRLDGSGRFLDAADVLDKFKNFFVKELPDNLRTFFADPLLLYVTADQDEPSPNLDTLVEKALMNDQTPADVFNIRVQGRRLPDERPLLSEHVTADYRCQFLKDAVEAARETGEITDEDLQKLGIDFKNATTSSNGLKEALKKCADEAIQKRLCARLILETARNGLRGLLEDGAADPLQYIEETLVDAGNKNPALAVVENDILNSGGLRDAAFLLLKDKESVSVKLVSNILNTELPDLPNEKPIDIDSTGKLTLRDKKYDIGSFTRYEPGHFITYTRVGDKCYKLDNYSKQKVKIIELADFVSAAKTAYLYTIRAESLTPAAASADAAQSKKTAEPVVEPNKSEETVRVKTGDSSFVDLVVETGSMQGAGDGFTIANSTTGELEGLHPQLEADKVMTKGQYENVLKAAKIKNKRFGDFARSPYGPRNFIGPRSVVTYTGPNGNKHRRKLLNTPLPILRTEADMAQAIADILMAAKDCGVTKIALPLLVYEGGNADENIAAIMKKGIQAYLNKDPTWGNGEGQIKIIQPREAAGAA